MSLTPITNEPPRFVAGDTVKWTVTLDDYTPADGTLTYVFASATFQYDVNATDNGDGSFLVTIPADESLTFPAGDYTYQASLTIGTERTTLRRGSVTVEADYATSTTGYDGRTETKQLLDAVESLLIGKASADVASYSINGRSLAHFSWTELYALRDRLRADYAREQQEDRIARGLASKSTVRIRFT